MVRITPNRWTGRAAHRLQKAIHAMRSFSLIGTLLLTALAFIGSAIPVHAYCPPSHLCYKKTVAIQTAGSAQGIPCNTMNGGLLDFGSLPRDGSGSVTLRVCVCPTDAQFPWSGTTGIDFLGITIGDPNDFTIIDSGTVTQGVAAQMPGANGCNNGITFYDNGSGFPGCGSGNPTNYCYADIQFKPTQYGTVMPTVNIGAACPGSNTSNVPPNCVDYPPGAIYDYQAEPVTLKGIGSGFAMLQPTNGTAVSLSLPTSTSDPGSAFVNYQAQGDSSVNVTWENTIRYRPSGAKTTFSAPSTTFKTSGGESPISSQYTGEGGFLTVTALAEKASACATVPIIGWQTPINSDGTCSAPVCCTISQELKSAYNFAPTGSMEPQLLEQLAMTESTYQQFFPISLTQPSTGAKCDLVSPVAGVWPHQNYVPATGGTKNGAFIGLLQVPNSENNAWNWTTNVAAGAKDFKAKLKTAKHYNKNRIAEDPGLPSMVLTPKMLEQTALGLYKGFAYSDGSKEVDWYWVPQCSSDPDLEKGNCVNGSWSWQQNPVPCKEGTDSCSPPDNVIVQVDGVFATTPPCPQ